MPYNRLKSKLKINAGNSNQRDMQIPYSAPASSSPLIQDDSRVGVSSSDVKEILSPAVMLFKPKTKPQVQPAFVSEHSDVAALFMGGAKK